VKVFAGQRREALALAIEDVAIGLFASRPMAQVKVEEIAATAGVAIRTLYRYFPTKEHIFAGMPRRGAERVAACIRARPPRESPFRALRNSLIEVEGEVEIAELKRWMQAVVNSDAVDRIARTALVASTQVLSAALAERSGHNIDDMWPQMAGMLAAGALQVGVQHWAGNGGNLLEHQINALDIAGEGIGRMPSALSLHKRC
jgi:AcrR family transcriptional regulator